jgi:hypothetical protein
VASETGDSLEREQRAILAALAAGELNVAEADRLLVALDEREAR